MKTPRIQIVAQNAADCGTDPAGYMMQRPGLSVFTLHDGEVYLTYATTNRGLGVVMTYYGILDRTPRGRVATARAYENFGKDLPKRQTRLF